MLPTEKFFVPREEILKLTSNSFEHRVVRIETALLAEKARLFEDAVPQILGTFEGRVMVLTDAGKCFAVSYEEGVNGVPHFLKSELVEAAVYPRSALPSFLRKEAQRAVDLYIKGDVVESAAKISLLAKMVDDTAVYDDTKIVDSFIANITSSRAWKKVLEAKSGADIKSLLGESFEQLQSAQLQPKFSKLYDGSLVGEELEKYRNLVSSDLGSLNERLTSLLTTTLKTFGQLRDVVAKLPVEAKSTGTEFSAFAEDLVDDLHQAVQAFAETRQGVDAVGSLGRLFDAVVEELYRYEVAGGLVETFTRELSQSSGS